MICCCCPLPRASGQDEQGGKVSSIPQLRATGWHSWMHPGAQYSTYPNSRCAAPTPMLSPMPHQPYLQHIPRHTSQGILAPASICMLTRAAPATLLLHALSRPAADAAVCMPCCLCAAAAPAARAAACLRMHDPELRHTCVACPALGRCRRCLMLPPIQQCRGRRAAPHPSPHVPLTHGAGSCCSCTVEPSPQYLEIVVPSYPAKFGPRVPAGGIEGVLVVSSPALLLLRNFTMKFTVVSILCLLPRLLPSYVLILPGEV